MPYFFNDKINLLFIHIPKTGGTSLEQYFSKKFNIPLDDRSLYMFLNNITQQKNNVIINSSMHHLTYQTIMKHKQFFNIMDDCQIISIVRNPYERCVSGLFFHEKININSTQDDIFLMIQEHIKENNDNHALPQYLFVTDENKNLIDKIRILKTESLINDMQNLGYNDFSYYENINKNKVNYYDYLNNDSIKLINDYYNYDFLLFNYEKIILSIINN